MNITPAEQRIKLGFKDGFITLLQGNTYAAREWLKANGAKYHKEFNWFFPSDVEVPAQFPNDLVPVRLYLDEIVSDKENEFIVFDKHFHQIIDSKRYPASSSEWVGEIGKTQEFILKYVNCFGFQSQFGYTHIYNFEDKDGNIVKTMTTRALDVEADTWYSITARVKSHDTYHNEKQTMINYVKINSLYFDDEMEEPF